MHVIRGQMDRKSSFTAALYRYLGARLYFAKPIQARATRSPLIASSGFGRRLNSANLLSWRRMFAGCQASESFVSDIPIGYYSAGRHVDFVPCVRVQVMR